MNKRDVKRNSRGQIISYEIFGTNDSTMDSEQYGDVELTNDENGPSFAIKYVSNPPLGELGYTDLVDNTFSDELVPGRFGFEQPPINLIVGEIIGEDIVDVNLDTFVYGSSNNSTTPPPRPQRGPVPSGRRA